MTYEVVPYTPDLQAELVRLQTYLWSADAIRNAEYFQWKYADNPYLHEPLIRIALRDGRAVAMRGLFGAMWEAGAAGATVLPYADDFVVAPADRNSGIARRVLHESLADAARRGYPYAVSLSAGAVTFVASLAAGWRSAGSYQPACRDLAPPSRWRRWLGGARSTLGADPFAGLDRCGAAGAVSMQRAVRPEEMAELIARTPWDGRIRHVRDARHFAWRFRNPLHEYRFVYWDEGSALQGYLVLQRYLAERADRLRVNIVDWEAVDQHVRAGLLEAVLTRGRFARLHTWTVGAAAPVRALLSRHGFVAADDPAGGIRARSSGLLVRRLGAGVDGNDWRLGDRNLLDVADWDLRPLYSMAG